MLQKRQSVKGLGVLDVEVGRVMEREMSDRCAIKLSGHILLCKRIGGKMLFEEIRREVVMI